MKPFLLCVTCCKPSEKVDLIISPYSYIDVWLFSLSDLTTVTTSGKSKASCSAANVAPPSASTHQWPWRPSRQTAHQRTSSSPVHRLTPALPIVPPVLPKTFLTLSVATCTHDWWTNGGVLCAPIALEHLSVNLYCISMVHWPLWELVKCITLNQMHKQRTNCSFIPPNVSWTAGGSDITHSTQQERLKKKEKTD